MPSATHLPLLCLSPTHSFLLTLSCISANTCRRLCRQVMTPLLVMKLECWWVLAHLLLHFCQCLRVLVFSVPGISTTQTPCVPFAPLYCVCCLHSPSSYHLPHRHSSNSHCPPTSCLLHFPPCRPLSVSDASISSMSSSPTLSHSLSDASIFYTYAQ